MAVPYLLYIDKMLTNYKKCGQFNSNVNSM